MVLTEKQSIVLRAIQSYYSRHKIMPTIREIIRECESLGLFIKSPRSISLFLEKLEDKGLIKRTGKERGIVLINKEKDINSNIVDIPILGAANAGDPALVAEQQIEGYLKVSDDLIKNKKVFAIRVSGWSMDRAIVAGKKIKSGDYIIVNTEDKNFQDNDRVLATIDGLATIKKLKIINKDKYGLFPESSDPSHMPIYITKDDIAIINGKIIDVFPASDDFLSNGDDLIYEKIIE